MVFSGYICPVFDDSRALSSLLLAVGHLAGGGRGNDICCVAGGFFLSKKSSGIWRDCIGKRSACGRLNVWR